MWQCMSRLITVGARLLTCRHSPGARHPDSSKHEHCCATKTYSCSCSFGVVLWEIITKQAPVRGHLREVRDDEAPPGVQKLLEDCINVDVSMKLSRK